LASSNEWMWSYEPLNWVRLDSNKKMYALLYQLQVVFNDDDVGIASTKSRKWPTQSALTEISIGAKPPNLFVCSHFKAPRGFLSRVINRSPKIRRWRMHAFVSSKGKPPRAKPSLQKPLKDRGSSYEIMFRTLLFWSKS
jgi:hypothetical protein